MIMRMIRDSTFCNRPNKMKLTIRAALLGIVLVALPVSMAAGQETTNAQQEAQPTATAGMAAASLADPTAGAISICVVPGSGTVYRVGVTGAPSKCLQPSHQLLKLNLTGVQGEMGPAGPAGEAGPAGAAGAAGVAGSAGVAGEVGPIGPAGPVGAVGATGAVGSAGAIGAPGVAGSVGPAGPSGPSGATGVAGPVGPTGATGATGAAGVAGPVGPAGANGADGVAGTVGPAGPVGPAGADGPMGEQGSVGPAGAAGVAGSQGPIGPAGADGEVGQAGARGEAGGMSGYERVVSVGTNVYMGQTVTVSKSCSAGKTVIGGGLTLSSPMERDVMASTLASYPSADDTWTVRVNNSDWGMGMDFTVSAYAICVNSAPPG